MWEQVLLTIIVDLVRLLAQTESQLEPPQLMDLERKIKIHKNENFKESSYYSDEVACMFFKWHPTEGPFIIIPSMDTKDKQATFKISGWKIEFRQFSRTNQSTSFPSTRARTKLPLENGRLRFRTEDVTCMTLLTRRRVQRELGV